MRRSFLAFGLMCQRTESHASEDEYVSKCKFRGRTRRFSAPLVRSAGANPNYKPLMLMILLGLVMRIYWMVSRRPRHQQ